MSELKRIYCVKVPIRRLVSQCLSILVVILGCLVLLTPSALAGLNDDRFDGNIFALYAGNGSLVPPRITLAESLKNQKPALLVFYLDDSSDCKQYSTVISQLQDPYGRAASFIPVSIDSLSPNATYTSTESGYYYQGLVPQTVLIDQKGKVVLNETGQTAYEKIDDVFREVFDLLPRSESLELKRRAFNEINTELTQQ
ncbi:MAG TPA: thioredoxin family protein [Cyanobacteria bacterium UBA8803]|nr:thioredoxin family protein [Cyanobacteria bacterium UBA9273]HBL62093.1 thioredoxin family protein [Cyanobacteria bacterium UBA8803]